jgi:DNA-binding CsgD family transcriptional regulator
VVARFDDTVISHLAELAGSREPQAFLTLAHALLSTIVPHRTAVIWCGMMIRVLGEEAAVRRRRARQAVRPHLERASSPRSSTEHTLNHAAESLLTGGALLTALGEPSSVRTRLLALEPLCEAGDCLSAVLGSQGWEHALIVPLRQVEDELMAGLVFYRAPEEPAFDATQVARIETLRPVLANLLSQLLERQQHNSTQSHILDFLTEFPVGLMLFDGQWRALFINEEAHRQTRLWQPGPAVAPRGEARDGFTVPREIREAGERLRQRWIADALGFVPAESALRESVAHPQHKEMKAMVTLLQAQDGVAHSPGVLVRYSGMATQLETTFHPSPAQLSILSQLTPGERNVALLVMRGMSNQEVADALHRDITTIKDHLTHIYDKLGIRGRTQLAAMLAG